MSATTLAPELEGRLRKLVALTMTLDLDQVLQVRRASYMDPETVELIPPQQLDMVFQMILTTKIQGLSSDSLQDAIRTDGASLLASESASYPAALRTEDAAIVKAALALLTESEDPPPPTEKPSAEFEHIFDDAMCDHMAYLFKFFEVPESKKGSATLPYALSPDFVRGFQSVLRAHILPSMRQSRMVMAMGTSHNWAEAGTAKVTEIIKSGEMNNPILYAWDDRWASTYIPKPPKEEKKKGLLSKFKSKKAPPVTQSKAQIETEKRAKSIWKALKRDAAEHGYFSAQQRDLIVFQSLLRYDMEKLETAWNELEALYNQEFEPKKHQDPGREGSFRDGLNKWHNRLEAHAGEFLVIKLFFHYGKCDLEFLKKYSVTHGVSVDERKRNVPYLMEFLSQFD